MFFGWLWEGKRVLSSDDAKGGMVKILHYPGNKHGFRCLENIALWVKRKLIEKCHIYCVQYHTNYYVMHTILLTIIIPSWIFFFQPNSVFNYREDIYVRFREMPIGLIENMLAYMRKAYSISAKWRIFFYILNEFQSNSELICILMSQQSCWNSCFISKLFKIYVKEKNQYLK